MDTVTALMPIRSAKQKPSEIVEIDRDHGIAKDMFFFCYTGNTTVRNMVGGLEIQENNATRELGFAHFNGTSAYVDLTGLVVPNDNVTFVALVRFDTGSTGRVFDAVSRIILERNSSTGKLRLFTVSSWKESTLDVPLDTDVLVGFHQQAGVGSTIFVNEQTDFLSSDRDNTSGGALMAFNTGAANWCKGTLYYAGFLDRIMSDGEIASLARDPYQFLKPPTPNKLIITTQPPANATAGLRVPDPRWEEPALLQAGVKPTGPVVVDTEHPLAKGLVRCVLMQGPSLSDLANGKTYTKGGAASPVWGIGTEPKWNFVHASTTSGDFINMGDFDIDTGDLTVIAKIKWTGVTTSALNIVAADDHVAVDRSFQFRLDGGSPNDIGFIVFSGGSSYGATSTSSPVTINEDIIIGATYDSAVGQEVYAGGVSVATNTQTGDLDNDPAPFSIGSRQYGAGFEGEPFEGDIYWVFVWNRPLSAAEHASINRDPHQFLCPA